MKKKVVKALILCGVLGILGVGGTMAYLTDYDSTVNEFTVGKVDIELKEPNWKPEDNTQIEPTEVINKDPQVKNIGVNDAFVYLEVSIPTANVITAQADGTRVDKKNTELFSFTKKADWTQIDARTVDGYRVYTFCYNKILKKDQTTSTLFDTVTFANIVEGQLELQKLDIPVRAYAIQTVNTGGDSGSIPKQAEVAFAKYYHQNDNQPGAAKGQVSEQSSTYDVGVTDGPSASDTETSSEAPSNVQIDPGVSEGPGASA